MPDLLRLYYRLPYPLRVTAATARGALLGRWRYGPATERLVEQALARESWSAGQWQAWQSERLAEMLEHAAGQVPYYREQWAARRRAGDHAAVDRLENWPVLTKEPLRQHPLAFVADGYAAGKLLKEQTSGSTGTPVELRSDRAAQQAWYALFEARTRRWNGVGRADRWGMLGGQRVAPFEQDRPPFWVWNAALKQLYLSAYHIKPEHAAAYAAALARYRLAYLLGYPSALAALASVIESAGLSAPPMRVVISNAEPLLPEHKAILQRVFAARVIDTYGMSEMVTGASECACGVMHLWPEAGVTEVLADDADRPLPPGEPGRLILTGLLNRAMPLIRYQISDRGVLAAPGEPCACGRSLPVLASIEGRMDDVILTRDGRRVGRLAHLIHFELPVREAQVVQESVELLRVRVVPEAGFGLEHERLIAARVRDRIGDIQVQVERVPAIERGPNGKFKAVVSKVGRSS
jgi:phenylacetate-CoA ligase